MLRFAQFTTESGGAMLVNAEHIIGIVEHNGKVWIRTVDDKGADRIMETMAEVINILNDLND